MRRRWPILAMTVATGLLTGQTWQLIAADAGRHFLWGSAGRLPADRPACRWSSAASASSPTSACWSWPTARIRCLQELVRRAPGTYTHSMTVATLAEAAAEAIGANPLLVRVGSYFHDIGKMLKPHYFIENQTGENRHDDLEPALSTLVIIGHVKDGVALAEQYRLPRPIIDFIAAAPRHDAGRVLLPRSDAPAGERGPRRPASWRRRSAIRARSRRTARTASSCWPTPSRAPAASLADPTPGSLRKLVHDLLMKRLLDGQFEESGLTLTELHLIEESLCKSLIALYHTRIRYDSKEPKETKEAS